jgi:DNA-binding response OmpR family regulator
LDGADVYLGFRAALQQSVGSGREEPVGIATAAGGLLAEHIVIVDDDELLRGRLAAYLAGEGFRVTTADSAATFRSIMRRERIDLALVDLTMPGEDGLSLTRFLREQSDIGVVILTGKGDPIERAIGLEVGADDYVAKPFHLRELLARVRSVLRRTKSRSDRDPGAGAPVVRFAGWRLDLAKRSLTSPRGKTVPLTTAEYQLLEAFVANPNQVLGRERLLQLVAARQWQPYDRTIDQHISRVRRKLERDPKQPDLIKSIRGQGYLFAAQIERER